MNQSEHGRDAWRFAAGDAGFVRHFQEAGFAVVEGVLSERALADVSAAVTDAAGREGYALRNLLLAVPAVRGLAAAPEIRALVEPLLGAAAVPVKGILFDKTPAANWKVAWHQDTTICVRERAAVPGYGPWSVKDGVVNVQPPADVLAGLVTVRVHLDDCGTDNGPLRVLPGSHQNGRLTAAAMERRLAENAPVNCTIRRGGVLLMRPLLLHASSAATRPAHRRVIHLEFAACSLPAPLQWALADGVR